MKNKKASAALVFLVVSILIISSGVIITNEIKKSNNENNIAGAGLILLNNKQDGSDTLSDSSGDGTKSFIFRDSGGKSSSKKSSGGGGSEKESLITGQIPSDLIAPETNETFDNQTSTNNIEENQSFSKSTNISVQFSDGQIFEEKGTKYIVRDSTTYALSSSEQISFNPPLPSSICVLPSGAGEKIDIKLTGSLSPTLNLNGVVACIYADYVGADIELKILENDVLADDLIASKIFHVSVNCDNPKVDYSNIFKDVVLSSFFGGIEGNTIEVYGLVKLTSSQLNDLEYSTIDYNIDKADCQCLTGSCCDTSIRPYKYKPSGSQPIEYTDEYICDEPNSPIGTNHCVKRDYYCSGTSADYSSSDSIQDTCGICEYCTPGDPTCNYYSSSTVCGTRDCDYLDTTCRKYNDVDRFCAGNSGTCNTASCTSYTNTQKGTTCGTGKECDGSGGCITCTTHSYYSCGDSDVYWYDACDTREDKKEECGEGYCGDWIRDTCHGNDAYETQTCYSKGCSNNGCYSNREVYERFVETCQYGCINGNCKSAIACYSNSDCGKDGYVGDNFCIDDDVYQSYIVYTCNNPGTTSSYCSSGDANILVKDCGEDGPSSNYCLDNDVYVNITDRGCSSGSCFENSTKQIVEDCGTSQCVNGICEGVKKPDLTVIDLIVQNKNGRTVTLAFTVKNIGELTANNTYWMVDTNSTDANPKRTVPATLAPGEWTRAYMMWTYSQSGNYQPAAIVDFDNLIRESNENNNRQSISVMV